MAQVFRNAPTEAARLVGASPAMDQVAAEVAAEVRAGWAAARDTGAIAASVSVESTPGKRGVTDRLVSSDAPGVLSAEFGHLTRLGKGTEGPRRWVPGLHIFGKVARHK